MQNVNVSIEQDRPTSRAALQTRLRAATSGLSFRQIAETVGCHPESARRWLTSSNRPPLWFIVALCDALQLNPHWAMTGLGAMHRDAARALDLNAASPRALLQRLAELLDAPRQSGRAPHPERETAEASAEEAPVPRGQTRGRKGGMLLAPSAGRAGVG